MNDRMDRVPNGRFGPGRADAHDPVRRPLFRVVDAPSETASGEIQDRPAALNQPVVIQGRSQRILSTQVKRRPTMMGLVRRGFIRLYQALRFPLYAIGLLKHRSFPVIDQQYLAYLDAVEASYCVNCSCGTGLLACSRKMMPASARPFGCPLRIP